MTLYIIIGAVAVAVLVALCIAVSRRRQDNSEWLDENRVYKSLAPIDPELTELLDDVQRFIDSGQNLNIRDGDGITE